MTKFKNAAITLFAITFLSLSACHHAPINSKLSKEWQPLSDKKNHKLLHKNTRTHKEYNGLHMTFQSHLIFLNSPVKTNQTKIKSQYKNWSETEASEELSKLNLSLQKESQFFLSFYSPNTKRNKLDQRASDWKVILKTSSSEHEGTIKYEDNISDHTKIFYPNIEHWGKPYKITFPVPTKELETSTFTIVLMGPEGMATFKY